MTELTAHDVDRNATTWIAASLCVLVAAPLIALAAGPIGGLLAPELDAKELLPWVRFYLHPEPRELGIYALALVLPIALVAATLARPRLSARLSPRAVQGAALLAKAGLCLMLVLSIVAQYRMRYEWLQGPPPPSREFFTPRTLAIAALLSAGIAGTTRSHGLRPNVARALRESRRRRIALLVLAAGMTGVWLLQAVQTDVSIAWADSGVMTHMAYTSDETFAVVNGLTPFVDSAPLYATLWPYVLALPLLVLGKTLFVYSLATTAVTAVALLAVFGIFRRVTGSSAVALLLYLPFLATSLWNLTRDHLNSFTPATYLADFPLRSAGPLLLAWLTARELDRPKPRAPWTLFAAAGLVALNNATFGLPALGATLAAVVATRPLTRRSALDLAVGMASGLALAVAAVAIVTLAHSGGSLPDFGQASAYSRLFLGGFGATPMHGIFGVHLLIYTTFVAAIVTATVRRRDHPDALTGMLLWSGVFGLGSASYFVVESGPLWLVAGFSFWALSLMLLAIVVLQRLAVRRPDLADLAVLFGVGLMVCSVAQLSAPWSQLERLAGDHRGQRRTAAELRPYAPDPRARAFVASLADGRRFYLARNAPVALLFENSHRVADAFEVKNVSPYANAFEMPTRAFLLRTIAALRRSGGNTILVSETKEPATAVHNELIRQDFGLVTARGVVRLTRPARPLTIMLRGETITKWVDLRNLHPSVLRRVRRTLVSAVSPRAG